MAGLNMTGPYSVSMVSMRPWRQNMDLSPWSHLYNPFFLSISFKFPYAFVFTRTVVFSTISQKKVGGKRKKMLLIGKSQVHAKSNHAQVHLWMHSLWFSSCHVRYSYFQPHRPLAHGKGGKLVLGRLDSYQGSPARTGTLVTKGRGNWQQIDLWDLHDF